MDTEQPLPLHEQISKYWPLFEGQLRGYASRILGSSSEAEDLVQDVCMLVFRRGQPYKSADHMRNFAFKTLRWRAIDRLRAAKRRAKLPKLLPESEPRSVSTTSTGSILQQATGTEVEALVSRLPPRQRMVVSRELSGQTTEQIAEEMQITVSTVRSLKRFARLAMAKLLEAEVPNEHT